MLHEISFNWRRLGSQCRLHTAWHVHVEAGCVITGTGECRCRVFITFVNRSNASIWRRCKLMIIHIARSQMSMRASPSVRARKSRSPKHVWWVTDQIETCAVLTSVGPSALELRFPNSHIYRGLFSSHFLWRLLHVRQPVCRVIAGVEQSLKLLAKE